MLRDKQEGFFAHLSALLEFQHTRDTQIPIAILCFRWLKTLVRLIGRQSASSVSRPSGEALRPVSQAAQRVGDSVKTSNTRPPGSLGEFGFRLNSTVPLRLRKIPKPYQLDNLEALQ